ncbi:MAG: type 2 lantipeptide synthetase LanM family protein [Deltaproteobacteria bacterium]|nr:type 2 lantipeptide synthetase LanM family protein [Deltaproteobacteria bacterium]
MLTRLVGDWPALVDAIGVPHDPGALTTALAAGDRHDDGRAVVLLRWSDGTELAYKPKPLAADRRFQQLLTWLNHHGATPRLRPLSILDCGRYGYSEVVEPRACRSEAEVGRFFERQGALLGLLYGLLATDFHCENVIAMGEHPYPIDLESLFHGQISNSDVAGVDAVSEADLVFSVLRVGLLPERANEAGGAPGLDLSGLGGHEGQLSPMPRPTWQGVGTDQMRLVRDRLPLMGSANRPSLHGAPVEPFEWTEHIVRGLTMIYSLLQTHRAELCAPGGPIDAFDEDVVRVIARPTRVYASLLGESYHPDLLRNAIDRDVYFDRLWSIAPGRSQLRQLVDIEQRDLWRGDIPKLTAKAGGRDLLHADTTLPEFFGHCGLSLARDHLARFDARDLAHQQWIVRAAMVAVATDVRAGKWARYRPDPHAPLLLPSQMVAEAERIATRLADTALETDDEATWLGLAFSGGHWVLAPLGTDLYGGLLGVALFLAHASAITGNADHRQLAQRAIATLIRKELASGRNETSIGGYSGLAATVYGLTQLAVVLDRPDLLTMAESRIPRFEPLIDQDETLDVLSGSSGAIGGLLSYHAITGDARALQMATRCGQRLISRAVPMAEGVGWPSAETGGRALGGFSHGAAGMAWALLRLFEATGDDRYQHTALEAIRYERTLFVPEEGNYYDLRPESLAGQDAQFSMAWCHGAPGVGLARAAQLPLLDDRARREVRVTAEATIGSLGRGHSLCHGDLGNLELVHRAGAVLDDASLRQAALRGISAAVDHGRRRRWLCGVPLSIQTPSLMVGIAGIGYQLLRFAHPDRVPSVLLLENATPAG